MKTGVLIVLPATLGVLWSIPAQPAAKVCFTGRVTAPAPDLGPEEARKREEVRAFEERRIRLAAAKQEVLDLREKTRRLREECLARGKRKARGG